MEIKFLLILAAGSAAVPASAAVTVIGSSAARICYEASESTAIPSFEILSRCDEALRVEPLTPYEIVATHVNRGILRARIGQVSAALSDFDTALARDPNEPEAYLNKGVVLMRQPNNANEALPLFNMALEKKTRRPALAYYGRGVANEELGNLRSAYEDFRKASVADPKWKEPKTELTRFQVTR